MNRKFNEITVETNGVRSIAGGGTGATTVAGALTELGAASASNSIRSIDASSTLQLSDASNTVSATSALTITVPLNSTAAFPIGSQVLLLKTTAGEVSIAAAAGVTLQAPGSASKIARVWDRLWR